jgi:hypothetical protein
MSAKIDISAILASLPTLSQAELEVVGATVGALRSAGARSSLRVPRQVKPVSGKKDSKKGPAKQESKHSSIKEYKAFKEADKNLSAFLKEKKITLKGAEGSFKDDPVLVKFREAQDHWFRVKREISDEGTSDPQKESEEEGKST